MAFDYCQEIGFKNMVSDGGNGITIDNKLIKIDPLERESVVKLLKECDEKGFTWAISYDNSKVRYTKSPKFVEDTKDTYMKTIVDENLDLDKIDIIYKAYIACTVENEGQIENLQNVPFARYQDTYVFVEPDDKSVGIKSILDYYHAPYEDAVVFGDNKNDLKMFRDEWTSIAMGNAIDELKERIVKENLNTYRSNQIVRSPRVRRFKSKKVRKTRMTGLQRQYFREMYRLGKIRKQPYSQVWKYRKDVKKFKLLQKQYLFLAKYDVTDVEQISDVQKDLRKKVSVLLKAKKVIVNEMDKHLKVFQAVENIDKEKKATIFYKMGDDTFKESEQIVSEARATLKEEGVSFEKVKKLKEYYTELLQANEKEIKQLRKEIGVGYKIIKEVKVRQEKKEIEERAIKEEKNKQEEQEKKHVRRK